jgi:signal peptidase
MEHIRRVVRTAIAEHLQSEGELQIWIRGNSMLPLLRNGDRIVVEPADSSSFRIGDILVYEAPDGPLAHRLIRRQECSGGLLLRGDAATLLETVRIESVLGRGVALVREGRRTDLTTTSVRLRGLWRNYRFQWKVRLTRRIASFSPGRQ